MTTLKELKNGNAPTEAVVYVTQPYVLLSKEKIVLDAGTLEYFLKEHATNYYDNCTVAVRRHDLQFIDNSKVGEAATTNLVDNEWKVETYGTACAITKIDINRPLFNGGSLRWSYTLMIEVYPTAKGINHSNARAAGFADAAIVSNHPSKIQKHTLVEIGGFIETPFGNYKIEFASPTDRDNLKIAEVGYKSATQLK